MVRLSVGQATHCISSNEDWLSLGFWFIAISPSVPFCRSFEVMICIADYTKLKDSIRKRMDGSSCEKQHGYFLWLVKAPAKQKKKGIPIGSQIYQIYMWGPADIYIGLIYTCSPQPGDVEHLESSSEVLWLKDPCLVLSSSLFLWKARVDRSLCSTSPSLSSLYSLTKRLPPHPHLFSPKTQSGHWMAEASKERENKVRKY